MKKISLLIVVTFLMCMGSCGAITEKQTLQDIITCSNVDFTDRNIQLNVHFYDRIYFLDNKYNNAVENFYKSLNEYEVEPVSEIKKTDIRYYIVFTTTDWEHINVIIDNEDQIEVSLGILTESSYYKCDGLYNALQEYFEPIFKESDLCYKVGITPVSHQYEYVIYDKDLNSIKYDLKSRQPNITRISEDVICLWCQEGTGIYARWSTYYNRETGEVSPKYSGQTDAFGTLTCNTGSGKVIVSDIFSGEELYVIEKFNEPLADSVENIVSAYFAEDGTQITVVYKNQNNEECEQIFDLPQIILP